jgi:hypothetical protein
MALGPLQERAAATPPVARLPASTGDGPQGGASGGVSRFAAVMRGLGDEVQRGETLMRTALDAGRAGRQLGTGELIALQAGVYRYGEVVDLASRLVDRATSSVKTVLDGQ